MIEGYILFYYSERCQLSCTEKEEKKDMSKKGLKRFYLNVPKRKERNRNNFFRWLALEEKSRPCSMIPLNVNAY